MTAIEQLSQRLSERKTLHERNFWKFAAEAARGEESDLDSVEGCLSATGKTLDDLAAAADTIRQRLATAETIAAAPAIVKERPGLESAIAAAGEELRRADERCRQITLPAQFRLKEIDAAEQAAHIGKIALVEQCPYAWLVEDRRRLQSEIADRERELSDFQGHFQGQKLAQELMDARKAAEEQHIALEVASARKATLKGVQNRHDVATRHREQLGNEIADLRKALVRLESEMLRP